MASMWSACYRWLCLSLSWISVVPESTGAPTCWVRDRWAEMALRMGRLQGSLSTRRDAFIFWRCTCKSPHTQWLKIIITETHSLTVLEAGSPKHLRAVFPTAAPGENPSCLFQHQRLPPLSWRVTTSLQTLIPSSRPVLLVCLSFLCVF